MTDTILDLLHEQINALGGASQSEYGNGYNAAILDVLSLIEKLGGKDTLMLRAEISELREALKPFADLADRVADGRIKPMQGHMVWASLEDLRTARAKLEGSGE